VAESEEIRPPPQAPQTEDEEEILLEHSEPAAPDQVLGEAEGEGQPNLLLPSWASGPSRSARSPTTFSVHIEAVPTAQSSSSEIASSGGRRSTCAFGPEFAYQLTFVKKGYQSASKRFTVTGRKNQRVTITLNRKPGARPAPKKSLFRRIFGR